MEPNHDVLEAARESEELIPQRLALDDEPGSGHPLGLTLEWQMGAIFLKRHVDREVQTVSPTRDEFERAGRCLHAATAAATVLLAAVLLEDILDVDDVDLLAVLGQTFPDLEPPTARRASLICSVEQMRWRFLDRELGLRRGAVALGRLFVWLGHVAVCSVPPLAAGAVGALVRFAHVTAPAG